jgi:hypothetical protein
LTVNASEDFRSAFQRLAADNLHGAALKAAAIDGTLKEWTAALTSLAVAACRDIGWRASAIGHSLPLLPIQRSEYLALDLIAFAPGEARWLFPTAAMEFENIQREDHIAYSLWKVVCVRADLRIVFCYRKEASQASELVRYLTREVIDAMSLEGRVALEGETVVVVGSRNDAATFPFGFFSWWKLDTNTGKFSKI